MNDDGKMSEFQQHYIDTLVTIKSGLTTIADGQKSLYDHISRNSDEQTKQLANIAADIRVMRERFSNIELRNMMLPYKKNGDTSTNGNGNGKSNQSDTGKFKNSSKKDITERLDAEEDFDKEMTYRYIGKFIMGNWKFIAIVIILALVGAALIFLGPDWVNWLHLAPVKRV